MAFPFPYSNLRMRQINDALGMSTSIRATTLGSSVAETCDIMVVLGNQIVPPVAGRGKRLNIFICQFPFEAPEEEIRSRAGYLATFDEIWVYSQFVRRYVSGYLRLLDLPATSVRVVYPPATLPTPARLPSWPDRKLVLSVGRFFEGGHNKRQDVVIEIVKRLSQKHGAPISLALGGSLHATASSRARFNELVEMAKGCDCRFYPNANRQELLDLYAQSGVLIHAAGYQVDKFAHPEGLEHFGIAPVEAASVGCIPLVYDEGGPAEVMDLLGCPTTFHSIPEAVDQLAGLLADPNGSAALSEELIRRSTTFSTGMFRTRVNEALTSLL
ncbi:MAG TPA: glycosyltransferase [Acidimicrobiales bacterium]